MLIVPIPTKLFRPKYIDQIVPTKLFNPIFSIKLLGPINKSALTENNSVFNSKDNDIIKYLIVIILTIVKPT